MQNNITSRRIFTYNELTKILVGASGEPLVDVRTHDPSIVAQYSQLDMKPYTGEAILVRDSLSKMLANTNVTLRKHGCRLKVVYGYRHPEVQEKYFKKRKSELKEQYPTLSEDELDALTHEFVAVPTVGGHPAGAAVDVTIVDAKGKEIDMGTIIADFSDAQKIRTYTDGLTVEQNENRLILHDAMVKAGFAPFYGEWWHFSYGDREWAAMYEQKKALYGAIEYRTVG